MPADGDEDVGGLDVAMDDALGMRGIERVGDLYGQRQQRVQFQGTPADAVAQRHSLQKLHGYEGATVLLADIVNGADVGMVQRRCSLGFALKAGQGNGAAGQVVGQELEGNETMQADVFSFVDHPHAAAPEFLEDAVARDGLADH